MRAESGAFRASAAVLYVLLTAGAPVFVRLPALDAELAGRN